MQDPSSSTSGDPPGQSGFLPNDQEGAPKSHEEMESLFRPRRPWYSWFSPMGFYRRFSGSEDLPDADQQHQHEGSPAEHLDADNVLAPDARLDQVPDRPPRRSSSAGFGVFVYPIRAALFIVGLCFLAIPNAVLSARSQLISGASYAFTALWNSSSSAIGSIPIPDLASQTLTGFASKLAATASLSNSEIVQFLTISFAAFGTVGILPACIFLFYRKVSNARTYVRTTVARINTYISNARRASRVVGALIITGTAATALSILWRIYGTRIKQFVQSKMVAKDPEVESARPERNPQQDSDRGKVYTSLVSSISDTLTLLLCAFGIGSGSAALLHKARIVSLVGATLTRLCGGFDSSFWSLEKARTFDLLRSRPRSWWPFSPAYDKKILESLPPLWVYPHISAARVQENVYRAPHGNYNCRRSSSSLGVCVADATSYWMAFIASRDWRGLSDDEIKTSLAQHACSFLYDETHANRSAYLAELLLSIDSSMVSSLPKLTDLLAKCGIGAISALAVGFTIYACTHLVRRAKREIAKETYKPDDFFDTDDLLHGKRKMKFSNDPAVLRQLQDLRDDFDDDPRNGGAIREADFDLTKILSRLSFGSSPLISTFLPLLKDSLLRPEKSNVGPNTLTEEEAFIIEHDPSYAKNFGPTIPEADVPNAPRIPFTMNAYERGATFGIKAWSPDSEAIGTAFMVVLGSRTVVCTVAHLCDSADVPNTRFTILRGTTEEPVTFIKSINDISVFHIERPDPSHPKPFKFSSIGLEPGMPVSRIGRDGIYPGHFLGSPVSYSVGTDNALAVTYTSVGGDSGSPIVHASAAGVGTLVGLHACSGRPGHSNGMWVLDRAFWKNLDQYVLAWYEGRKQKPTPSPSPSIQQTSPDDAEKKKKKTSGTYVRRETVPNDVTDLAVKISQLSPEARELFRNLIAAKPAVGEAPSTSIE